MLTMEIGLGVLLLTLAVVMLWRLADLFSRQGRWKEEVDRELSAEVR